MTRHNNCNRPTATELTKPVSTLRNCTISDYAGADLAVFCKSNLDLVLVNMLANTPV